MVLLLVACYALGRRHGQRCLDCGRFCASLRGDAVAPVRYERVLAAAALIVPSFVRLSLPNAAWRRSIFAAAAGSAVANLAVVWWVWLSDRSEFATLIASFD